MANGDRKTGIDIIGDRPWGTHFCQFYDSKEDLIETLVPYFKAGLENNEFCMWVTSEPLGVKEAEASLRKAIKSLDKYIEKGQIEILDYSEWYTKSGKFDADQVLQGWVDKEKSAFEKGFDGLRLTGNTFWLEHKDWDAFAKYEKAVDNVIDNYRMLAICTYSLERCSMTELLDVVASHRFALIRKEDEWQVIRTAEQGRLHVALDSEIQNFRNSLDDSPLGIRIITAEGELLYTNKAMLDIYGYSSFEELKNTPAKQRYTPESYAEHEERKEKRKQGGFVPSNYEISIVRKDGEIRYLEVLCNEIIWNGERRFQSLYQDKTEYKRAEETLQETRGYLESLIQYANAPIIVWDTEMRITLFNRAFQKMTGYMAEEVMGQSLIMLFLEASRDESLVKIKQTSSGECLESVEIPILCKDGMTRIVLWNSANILDRDGKTIIATIAQGQDITGRRQAEEALIESEERLRTLIENAPDIIFVREVGGKLIACNKRVEELLGYSQDELVGKDFPSIDTAAPQIVSPDYMNKVRENLEKSAQCQSSGPYECEMIRKDGTLISVEITTFPVTTKGKLEVIGIARDITERRKLQEEEQKIEKLESIGTLAGGIAHDFNNLLTGILGNISLAERHVEPKGKAAERLLEAKKASLRARDLTQQMLTFAKGGAPIKKIVSIAELLEELVTFALRGSNIKCEFFLPDDLWPINVDEGQMNQAITNLILNADEAMPQGGLVNIGAKNTVIKGKTTLPLPKGNYVEITIQDFGVGIAKEHLGRIFEPYFTTKQKGSGLGLATTYSVLKRHDGYITVKSKLGAGTTFYIYLPASKKPLANRKVEEPAQPAFPGKGKILVMDDEEAVTEMLSNMLSDGGYEVVVTRDGEEAVERYAKAKESGQPFDAVILDITIPGGMGGKEAIKKLFEIDPQVKAIVSSGYSTDPIMAKFRKYGFSAVATKPYSVGELERTLSRILRGGGGR